MSKGTNKKKSDKKKPLKTLDEKRQAKKEKKANRDVPGTIVPSSPSR